MTQSEQITISVPEPMASRIRDAVQAGDYDSMSDVIADAMRLWSDRREAGEQDVVHLRQAWDVGKASGMHGRMDFGELRREVRDLLKKQLAGKPDPDHAG